MPSPLSSSIISAPALISFTLLRLHPSCTRLLPMNFFLLFTFALKSSRGHLGLFFPRSLLKLSIMGSATLATAFGCVSSTYTCKSELGFGPQPLCVSYSLSTKKQELHACLPHASLLCSFKGASFLRFSCPERHRMHLHMLLM